MMTSIQVVETTFLLPLFAAFVHVPMVSANACVYVCVCVTHVCVCVWVTVCVCV